MRFAARAQLGDRRRPSAPAYRRLPDIQALTRPLPRRAGGRQCPSPCRRTARGRIERVSETADPATSPCVAFTLPDGSGRERIVLVLEVRPLHLGGRTPATLADLIRRRLAHELRLAPA
ncbi:hypothetical protein ABZ078_00455 [Streptomyces sp. NPDC006385]|uniref:hypothetical protein n=1 Tax=Streptomyces sp. NPDC006385 TaxID=3156761 RepID=UPI0033AB9405